MEKPLNFVGLKPCGCMALAISGSMSAKEAAKSVAKGIRLGLDIQRWTDAQVRTGNFYCGVCKPARAKGSKV